MAAGGLLFAGAGRAGGDDGVLMLLYELRPQE